MTLNLKFKGFDYNSYYNGAYGDDSLPSLVQTGANSIETSLDWGIDPQNDTVYDDSLYTDSLAAESKVIKEAVADGLSVMVKPAIDFVKPSDLTGTPYTVGDWRTYFNPGKAGSTTANTFFASYKTMILQEASMAESSGATLFSIGTELDGICGPSYKSYWDSIISAVRSADPNLKLTYAADWNDDLSPWQYAPSNASYPALPVGTGNFATQISFASELDYFGIDSYAPLANTTTPTLQQLINGWTEAPVNSGETAGTYDVTGGASLISYYESVATAVGKPILFTEIGYENASDAAEAPAGAASNATEDDNLQAELYQSFFQSWTQSGNSSLAGAYLYNWDPNDDEVGKGAINFSPQTGPGGSLPALAVVEKYFGNTGTTVSAPATDVSGSGFSVGVPNVVVTSSDTTGTIAVTLAASHGALLASTAISGGGGTISGSNTGSLVISGTLAQVNADLTTLRYTATGSVNDTIAISTTDAGAAGGTASTAVTYDANLPDVGFNTIAQSGANFTFTGSVSAGGYNRTAALLVNGSQAGTATASGAGAWTITTTLTTGEVDEVYAKSSDAAGNVSYSAPLLIGASGGLTFNLGAVDVDSLSALGGDVAELFNAGSTADTVNGSNGYIIVYGSRATINGGDDNIYTDGLASDNVTLTGTNGQWDYFQGANATVSLNGAQATVSGGDETIYLAGSSADTVALSTTGGNWDGVTGSNATISLSSAQASISGGGDSITFAGGSGNEVSLYNTNKNWDGVAAAGGVVYETSSQASVSGGGVYIDMIGSDDAVSLYATGSDWDGVTATNGVIYETSASASITGGGESITMIGSGDAVSLYATGSSNWDGVTATNGVIYETNASASVSGGGEYIDMLGSGDAVSLYSTGSNWDGVTATSGVIYETGASSSVTGGGNYVDMLGSDDAVSLYATGSNWDSVTATNGVIYETNASASVSGGGNFIDMLGSGDAASLYSTGSSADTVVGSSGTVYLTTAQVDLTGSSDGVNFAGNDALTVSGSSDTFAFGAAMGLSSISGFASSDVIQLASSDFANWAALQPHIAQSGANTTITYNASNVLTLDNVTASSLTQSEFRFA